MTVRAGGTMGAAVLSLVACAPAPVSVPADAPAPVIVPAGLAAPVSPPVPRPARAAPGDPLADAPRAVRNACVAAIGAGPLRNDALRSGDAITDAQRAAFLDCLARG